MSYNIVLFISLFLASIDSEKLVTTKLPEGISFGLPESMHAMTDVEIASKYISYRNGLGFFTDQDRLADFIVNNSVTPWSANDMEMLKDVYKTSIFNLYTNVSMIEEGIREYHGRNFICFEFISSVSGDENSIVKQNAIVAYNFVAYTIVKNKVYVFTFTCPSRLQSKWQDTANAMMESIKIK